MMGGAGSGGEDACEKMMFKEFSKMSESLKAEMLEGMSKSELKEYHRIMDRYNEKNKNKLKMLQIKRRKR